MSKKKPEYVIHIRKCLDKAAGEYAGTLLASQIDPRLTGTDAGSIKIELSAGYSGFGRGVMTIDRFLSESIEEFLSTQDDICKMVEDALYESFENRLKEFYDDVGITFEGLDSKEDVWKYSVFENLSLRIRRDAADPKLIEEMLQLTPKIKNNPDFMRMLIEGDPPNCVSSYRLVFNCKWDEEHLIEVEFLDGKCQGAFLR